jgi:hypothetical protein
MNLQTIKDDRKRGRMSQEQIEWLVKRVERYEEAFDKLSWHSAALKGNSYFAEVKRGD